MGIAELRRSVDTTTEEQRPVPLLEREERQSQQKTRLRGVECEALQRPLTRPSFQRPLGNKLFLTRLFKDFIRGRLSRPTHSATWLRVAINAIYSSVLSGRWAL